MGEAQFGTKGLYQDFDRAAQGQPVNWQLMWSAKQQMRNALNQIPYDTSLAEKLVGKLAARDVSDLSIWRSGMRDTLYSKGEGASARALTEVVDRMIEQSLPAGGPSISLLRSADRQHSITKLAQALDKRIGTVEQQVAATHSGANLDNKIRQTLVAFQKDERAWHSLTPHERVRIQSIINGGSGVNILRQTANLFGGGGGLGMTVAGLVGHAIVPYYGAVIAPLLGKLLKHAENRVIENQMRNLLGSVAGRSAFATPELGRLTVAPFPQRAARAAIYGGLAPQTYYGSQ
jgi:hypothetical protein